MFPNTNTTLPRVSDIITKGSNGIVVLPNNPTQDAIAGATALYLGLLKMGKNVTIVSSSPVKSDMVAADKIQSTLSVGGDNLVVSFPYTDGAIDKIDYHIQGDKFNLVIAPRPGFPKLNPNQVIYSYSGGTFDFIITVDAPNLNAVGTLYTENQAQFQGKEIINIDRHLTNAFFGTVNFINKTSSSTSELVYKVLRQLECEIDKDMATNLYTGIATATNTFTSYSVNAETFETVASLLKAGAAKKTTPQAPAYKPPVFETPVAPAPVIQQPQGPVSTPVFSVKQPGTERQQIQSIASVESQESQSKEGAQSPQDWLKPNIFKGGGLV
ncbi:MAG: DHH family phosphoesterase [Candidatus Roizmanbacteria bacterium]|nr:DHH family phosphoesterase [Candidatus Roizmanbacteria bacterium]